MKNKLKNLKDKLVKDIKEVKSIWEFNGKFFILTSELDNTQKRIFIKKINEFSQKNNIKLHSMQIPELFKEVMEYNKDILINIKDSNLIYDGLGLIKTIKINIEKGNLFGTKEFFFRRFVNINKKFKQISSRKLDIFTNIYTAVIEASQAILFLSQYNYTTHKKVVDKLKNLNKKGVINKEDVKFVQEVIKTYKDYEHEKISMPDSERLDYFTRKSEDFIRRAKNMIYK